MFFCDKWFKRKHIMCNIYNNNYPYTMAQNKEFDYMYFFWYFFKKSVSFFVTSFTNSSNYRMIKL